ncbi:MAG: phage holin family protein [Candidatus Latescibacterota bacterium]|nr:MAG: phage holin family protein [Candidatus Latescibacterota bacterium]
MRHIVARWLITTGAIGVVAWLLPGIHVGRGSEGVWTALVAGALLGIVNTLVKPVLMLLSCPLIVMTLGLFLFVVNAASLLIASNLSRALGFPFYVDGWGSAILGSILITIVAWILSGIFGSEAEEES